MGKFKGVRSKLLRRTALALPLLLTTTLLGDPATAANVAFHAPAVPQVKVLPRTALPTKTTRISETAQLPQLDNVWPESGSATATLPSSNTHGAARAGSLPVLLAAAPAAPAAAKGDAARGGASATAPSPSAVAVSVLSHATADAAKVPGVLFTVAPRTGSGPVSVSVDYSSFQNAGGADFGGRLRLVQLPACALTTPQVAACQVQTPLASSNDAAAKTVTATVNLPAAPTASHASAGTSAAAQPMVLAADDDASGSNGDYTATQLAPSGTWSEGGAAGDFTWSYPIPVPKPAAGAAPEVALNYNSADVDGRVATTNNQFGQIGEGFTLSDSYVARSYTDCADDPEGAIANDYDNCWAGQVVTLVLNGQSTSLILDSSGTWHEEEDSGDRVQYLTGTSTDTDNGTYDNGYWVVTTPNGTKYYFGKNRGPGWTSTDPSTNSTYTEPVYGAHAGDPCYNSTFADASCSQAWQWNLDFVVDANGNAQAYYYQPETNYYGADIKTAPVAYDRGGYPTEIDYGLHETGGSIYGTSAPQKVVFGTAERCVATGTANCDFTSTNTGSWPDTPVDDLCESSGTCNSHAPTFFTEYMINQITTEYYPSGSSTPVPVDSYALGQSFSTQGDSELLLNSITRTGYSASGAQSQLLPVDFKYALMNNRVPGYNAQPAMLHWRLTGIETETGEQITVTYSATCTLSDIPSDPSQNTSLCFPVYWIPDGKTVPILDYFNKYVVAEVEVADAEALTPPQITQYKYPPGAVLWHYDDNQLVKAANRTYGQFRGYPEVDTLSGDTTDNSANGTADAQTETKTFYYRGMNGDVLPGGGTRSADVTDTLGDSYPDNNAFADEVLETQQLDGVNGPEVSATINTLAVTATTGTMAVTGLPTLQATMVAPTLQRTVTDLAAGGTHVKTVKTTYDGYGRAVLVDTSGPGIAESCAQTSYAGPAPNPDTNTPSVWITDAAAEEITSAQACPSSPGSLTTADVLSDTRTYYDGSTSLSAAPSAGNATSVSKAVTDSSGTLNFQTDSTTGYDAMGRVVSSTDARGNTTKTSYTPAAGGPLTAETVTNPLNQTSSATYDPGRGSTLTSTTVSGYETSETYDPLGRVTAVWKPGRSQAAGASANLTYSYQTSQTHPLTVTTNTLVDYDTGTDYQTEISIYDGLGQLLQTQTEAEGGNTATTETFYDSHGWVVETYTEYVVSGSPSDAIATDAQSAVNDRTVTFFDADGRTTLQDDYDGDALTDSTQTIYGGDRSTTIKYDKNGTIVGTPTTTVTDLNGKTVETDEYSAAPTVTGNVVTPSAANAVLSTDTTFDAAGNKTKVTAAGSTWTYQYDLLGRQTSTTDPDTGTTTTAYDAGGNVSATKDADGNSLNYVYDALNRKTAEYTGSLTQGSGTKIATWVYDTLKVGELYYETSINPTTGAVYESGNLGFDQEGDVIGTFVKVPTSVTGLSGTYETKYTYSTTGLLEAESPATSTALPNDQLTFTYDQYGNLQSEKGYDTYATSASYTPYGELSRVQLGTGPSLGSLTYVYDPQTGNEKEVTLSVTAPTPQVDDTQYQYNADQQLVKSIDTEGGVGVNAPVETQCYTYDMLGRLNAAWSANDSCATDPFTAKSNATVGGPQAYAESWTFNNLGDRTSEIDLAPAGSSAGTTTTTYTYATPGHTDALTSTSSSNSVTGTGPTTSYAYDADGNTKTRASGAETLTWGTTGKLASDSNAKGATGYVYDADGNLLIESDPGSSTLFLPGEQLTYTTATAATTGVRSYTFDGHVIAESTGSNLFWLEGNDQGTMAVAVNAFTPTTVVRRVLTPYGDPVTGSATWVDDRSFLGDVQQAATGLVDVGARDYDPSIGAFVSVDPNMDSGAPQSMTGYEYAGDNPLCNPDPSGLSWWSDVTSVVHTVANVAAVAAPVLNAVAVCTAAVPGLDVVTAGVAATADIVDTVATVANVTAGAVNVVNDVSSGKSLLQTGLDVAGTVVAAKGLGGAGTDELDNQGVRSAVAESSEEASESKIVLVKASTTDSYSITGWPGDMGNTGPDGKDLLPAERPVEKALKTLNTFEGDETDLNNAYKDVEHYQTSLGKDTSVSKYDPYNPQHPFNNGPTDVLIGAAALINIIVTVIKNLILLF
jgi:RHS repeat-associated protein